MNVEQAYAIMGINTDTSHDDLYKRCKDLIKSINEAYQFIEDYRVVNSPAFPKMQDKYNVGLQYDHGYPVEIVASFDTRAEAEQYAKERNAVSAMHTSYWYCRVIES